MQAGRPRRLAYLLRLWEARNEEGATWRASLESAHTGERRAFSSLAALFAYLEEHTSCLPGQEEPSKTAETPREGMP